MNKHRQLVRTVSDEAYTALLEAQGGHCALCPSTPKTRRLHVDHDHKTMRVRALLCHRCNRALASWVTPKWLRDAANYLDHAAYIDEAFVKERLFGDQ